jgi:hypothetical protein
MTSYELANTLLQYPNLPLQVGNNITNFNRGSAIVGNLKVEITNNRILVDTDTPVLGYTPEEQQHIFDLCLNDEDWRKPVHAVIPDKIFNQYGEIKITRILEDSVGRIEISRIEAGYLITGNGYSANGQSRKVQVTGIQKSYTSVPFVERKIENYGNGYSANGQSRKVQVTKK